MTNSKTCREQRAAVLAEMGTIAEKVKTEARSMTKEEGEQFDTLDKRAEQLQAQAESFEKIERYEGLTLQESRQSLKAVDGTFPSKPFTQAEDRNKAYAGWFYHGTRRSKPEYWRAAERHGIDVTSPCMRFDWLPESQMEQRFSPMNTTVGTAGKDVVAVDNALMREIDIALKYTGNIFEFATTVPTPTGAPLPWPTNNDTSNNGRLDTEAGAMTETELTLGQSQLSSYIFDSDMVLVSFELLNDSIIDLGAFIGKQLGTRIARNANAVLLATGTGMNQPTSVISSCTLGATTASPTAVVYADLIALLESVDIYYQESPGCGFVFNQSFRQALRGLVDANGRPLMMSSLEGIALGLPKSLLDYPYYINNAMPSIGATNKVALFGDLKKIILRKVVGQNDDGGVMVYRLNERNADIGCVTFFARARFDGLLSDAGTHPLKYLQCHA